MPTSRLNLPYPAPTDPADGPAGIEGLADALDPYTAQAQQGTLAARPAPAIAGRFYHVAGDTDSNNDATYWDTGSAWTLASRPPLRIGGMPGGTTALTAGFTNSWAGGAASFAMPPLAANAIVAFSHSGTGMVTLTGAINIAGAAKTSMNIPAGGYANFIADQGGSAWWLIGKPPAVSAKIARTSSPYAIPAGETPIWYNGTIDDNGGIADPANSRIVIPYSGIYLLIAQMEIYGQNGQELYVRLGRNGVTGAIGTRSSPGAGGEAGFVVSDVIYCTAGDAIQGYSGAAITGPATLQVGTSGGITFLSVAGPL